MDARMDLEDTHPIEYCVFSIFFNFSKIMLDIHNSFLYTQH